MLKIINKYANGIQTIEDKFDEYYLAALIKDIDHYTILVALYDGIYTEDDSFDGSQVTYTMNGNNLVMFTDKATSEYVL